MINVQSMETGVHSRTAIPVWLRGASDAGVLRHDDTGGAKKRHAPCLSPGAKRFHTTCYPCQDPERPRLLSSNPEVRQARAEVLYNLQTFRDCLHCEMKDRRVLQRDPCEYVRWKIKFAELGTYIYGKKSGRRRPIGALSDTMVFSITNYTPWPRRLLPCPPWAPTSQCLCSVTFVSCCGSTMPGSGALQSGRRTRS